MKRQAHRLFDAIWKNGILSRKDVYRWMQDTFCLSSGQAHIGQFSDYRCDCLMTECRSLTANPSSRTAGYVISGSRCWLPSPIFISNRGSCSRFYKEVSMEPIPRPLSQQLALTLLVGAGCFLTGLVFWFSQKDKAFFLLSSVIFLCSCIRAASLFWKIRGKSYIALERVCTGYRPKLFAKYRKIYLLDSEGVSHTLLIGKDHKIRTGCSHRFYFLSPPDTLKEDSPWLEKAMLADSLLGIELLENVPVSGSASPSNMYL